MIGCWTPTLPIAILPEATCYTHACIDDGTKRQGGPAQRALVCFVFARFGNSVVTMDEGQIRDSASHERRWDGIGSRKSKDREWDRIKNVRVCVCVRGEFGIWIGIDSWQLFRLGLRMRTGGERGETRKRNREAEEKGMKTVSAD